MSADDELDDGLLGRPTEDDAATGNDPAPQLHYPTVYLFVEDFLTVAYARHYDPNGGAIRWCDRWWEHPEAVSRLDALWQAFEALRLEPGTGPASWWRDYCDPTMNALLATDGPFAQCRARQRHAPPPQLPSTGIPAALREADTGQ